MSYKIAGVTKTNDKEQDIQNLLKRLANGYKKNDYIVSWDGMTKREMLEYGEEQSEFQYQTISDVIRLEPEPSNPYDPNAIKVFMKDVNGGEHHVGYIKRDETNDITEQMKRSDFKFIAASFTGGKYRSVDYDDVADEDVIKEEELTRGLELTLVFEKPMSQQTKPITRDKPKELTKEEKKKQRLEKQIERSAKMTKVGKSMQKPGGAIAGCGCLLTLLITIPIIIIIFWLF
ncbi:HIRAN domain-containing protein [Bacillus sp. 1P02SD]|uniref:HIRAN domain-containing protein n=1 Tax=Bacillus sp. 1P02SD TaxID=3132264 RepID=UPI0039A297DE